MAWARMGEMRAGWGQGERVRGSPGFVLARQMVCLLFATDKSAIVGSPARH